MFSSSSGEKSSKNAWILSVFASSFQDDSFSFSQLTLHLSNLVLQVPLPSSKIGLVSNSEFGSVPWLEAKPSFFSSPGSRLIWFPCTDTANGSLSYGSLIRYVSGLRFCGKLSGLSGKIWTFGFHHFSLKSFSRFLGRIQGEKLEYVSCVTWLASRVFVYDWLCPNHYWHGYYGEGRFWDPERKNSTFFGQWTWLLGPVSGQKTWVWTLEQRKNEVNFFLCFSWRNWMGNVYFFISSWNF